MSRLPKAWLRSQAVVGVAKLVAFVGEIYRLSLARVIARGCRNEKCSNSCVKDIFGWLVVGVFL